MYLKRTEREGLFDSPGIPSFLIAEQFVPN